MCLQVFIEYFIGVYTQAVVSSQIIYNIRTSEETSWWSYLAFVGISVLILFSHHKNYLTAWLFTAKFRFMMIGVIYKKIHSLSLN